MKRTLGARALIGTVGAAAMLAGSAEAATAADLSGAAVAGASVTARGLTSAPLSSAAEPLVDRGGMGKKAESTADAKATVMHQATATHTDPGTGSAAADQLVQRLAEAARGHGSTSTGVPGLSPATSTPTSLTVTGDSGVLQFTAASTNNYVMFGFDGTATGDPVPVDGTTGTAVTSFPSWGYQNASYTVTAADCATADVASCDLQAPASANVTLANQAPLITKPSAGQRITGGFVITAESTGGGVQFLIDGRPTGFDGSAPYQFQYTGSALSAGRHVLTVVQCSSDGTLCDGPVSPGVAIVSDSLHPRIVSISPSPFSPAKNGVKDTTTLTFFLPDRENVRVLVTNARNQVVRGPIRLGQLSAARHTWTWNGRSASGQLLPSGRYRITLDTDRIVRDTVVRGQVWRVVTVDNHAPRLSMIQAPATIYPVHDGYRDTFTLRSRLSERATLLLTIRNASGRLIDRVRSTHAAGTVQFRWNGRDKHRALTPGRYTWTLTATDLAGNTGHTRPRHVTVSSKKLVTRTTTLTRTGDSYNQAGSTDRNCATASKSLSQYKHGVWMANTCFGESALVATFYRFSVPAAIRYSHLAVQAGGFTQYPPSSLEAAFGVNGSSHNFNIAKLGYIPNRKEAWWKLGGVNGANYVSTRHQVLLAVALDSRDAPCDFDLGAVKLRVTYQVLQ